MKLPHSLDKERTFLATLIKNPEIISDYIDHLSDDLFYKDVHKVICGAIRFQFKSKKTVDVIILSDHISNIGLKEQDGVDLPDYIRTIAARSAVTRDMAETYFKECYKYKIARSSINACQNTINSINKAINGDVGDIIAATEKGLATAQTVSVEDGYELIDLYENLDEFAENLGQKQGADGIMTPFKTWNRWWGPLTPGDFNIIASPPKTGKSTILNYLADVPFCRYNQGKVIKVLILDTELETERVKTRKIAALTDVNEIFIKNGKWQNDSDMVDKVTQKFPVMKKRSGNIKHVYVANTPIEKVCKIVRRWAATETDPDDLRLVIYDYMKITGETISGFNQEWQVLGQKCDTLKHLMSEKGVQASGLAAVQTNAAHDVASSQRIKWFASNILFFQKKSPEELARDGEEFGTHVLYPCVLRNQGEDWDDEMYVKEQTKTGVNYTINKLNLKVKNFNITECGTYADVVAKGQEQIDISASGPLLDTNEDDDGKPWNKRKTPLVIEDPL